MQFNLHIDLSRFSRFVQRMADALDLSRPGPMQAGALGSSDAYHESMRQRFAREGEGDWPPLRPATLRQREKLGFGDHPTLVRAGDLRDSLERGDGMHVLETRAGSIAEGTQHPLAIIHHHGSPGRNLPARTIYVPPVPAIASTMKQSMQEGLRGAVKEAAG